MVADNLVRELAQHLAVPGSPVKLKQGQVVSVESDMTCTVLLEGTTVAVAGWTWLFDAYVPQPNDLAWVLDGGPGQRFLIGPTKMSSSFRWQLGGFTPIVHVPGSASRLNNNTGWPDNILTSAGHGDTYNQSPAGNDATHELRYHILLSRVTYKLHTRMLGGSNIGRANFYITDPFTGVETLIGMHDGYNASFAPVGLLHATTFTALRPGPYTLTCRKAGSKNASSSDYYILFMHATLSPVALV